MPRKKYGRGSTVANLSFEKRFPKIRQSEKETVLANTWPLAGSDRHSPGIRDPAPVTIATSPAKSKDFGCVILNSLSVHFVLNLLLAALKRQIELLAM